MVELYYPRADTEAPLLTLPTRSQISVENNQWERLCKTLATFEDLRELRLWFHSQDLRSWHRRFAETRFFRSLWHVKARNFTLALPKLPQTRGMEESAYLDGEILDRAPFRVERGPRPNNWEVHLAVFHRVSLERLAMARQDQVEQAQAEQARPEQTRA